jgi:hypothetical protein
MIGTMLLWRRLETDSIDLYSLPDRESDWEPQRRMPPLELAGSLVRVIPCSFSASIQGADSAGRFCRRSRMSAVIRWAQNCNRLTIRFKIYMERECRPRVGDRDCCCALYLRIGLETHRRTASNAARHIGAGKGGILSPKARSFRK